MAIRKQNRTIWVLAAVPIVLLVIYLVREGELKRLFSSTQNGESKISAEAPETQFGDQVQSTDPDAILKFQETLDLMAKCFQISGSDLPESSPVEISTLLKKFQGDIGPVSQEADRWVNWHLRTRDGQERRLRLEITETDEGKVGRELHYFAVGSSGQPVPIELDPDKATNPTDEVISEMLKEGAVYSKERAAVAFFSNGERIEYVEKDGQLYEVQFFKEDLHFQCANVKMPQNCQCH